MVKSRILTILLILSLWVSTTAFQPAAPVHSTALPAPTDPFEPRTPANGAVNVQSSGLHLTWTALTPPQGVTYTYRYCLLTRNNNNKCPGGKWVNVGTSTNIALKTLQPNTTYYWWIRAMGSDGSVIDANTGKPWSFTTKALPGPFSKTAPANLSTNQPSNNLTLSWTASTSADSYQYCLDTTNNNFCDTAWVSVPSGTSVVLNGLNSNTLYYWQVRAVNVGGSLLADGGTWWQFSTSVLSNVFGKLYPANNTTLLPATTLTLSWEISAGATSYDYCLTKTVTTTGQTCDTSWVSLGLVNQVTVSSLDYSRDYYWQVRANTAGGARLANSGSFWKFTTIYSPPGAFGKTVPTNGTVNVPVNTTISWTATSSVGTVSYEYCITLTNGTTCDTDWTPTTGTTAVVSGLAYDTTYYWQVHAINASGTTEADGGQWFAFATQTAPPGAFTKSSPIGAVTQVSINPTLSWTPSAGIGVTYKVCYTTTPGGVCDNNTWYPTSATSISLAGLSYGTTYYWQVEAVNVTGTTDADGSSSAFASFTTLLAPPSAFFKSSPQPDALDQPQNLSLDWTTSSGTGVTYEVCVDTVNPGCASGTGWQAATQGYSPTGLQAGQKYYWQVRAKNSEGTATLADNGNWWDFTIITAPPSGFAKTSPADGQQNQPRDPWLYWTTSSGTQITYEYCVSKTIDLTCGGAWSLASSNISIHYPGLLDNSTTYYWQVRALDVHNNLTYADGSASSWRSFTVIPAPPTSQNVVVNNVDEGTPYSGTLSGTSPSSLPLTFASVGTPPVGSVIVGSTGSFTFTPPQFFVGAATFQFTVSDGINIPAGPYTVTINYVHVNHAPVLSAIAPMQVSTGDLATFTAVATDPDPGDTLTYSLGTTPPGATFDAATGIFGWVPVWSRTASNVYTFTVTVTDQGGLSASQPVTITVMPKWCFLPSISR